MTNRGESAARGETVAPLPTDWELQKKNLLRSLSNQKEKHQKKEKTSADSPTRKIWPPVHPKTPQPINRRAPTTSNPKPRFFTVELTV
jgi:hypothetical protein